MAMKNRMLKKILSAYSTVLVVTVGAPVWAQDQAPEDVQAPQAPQARAVMQDHSPANRALEAQQEGIKTFVVEDIGSGFGTDLYRVSCTAECIRADVNDAGPFDDTRFKVNINGSSSGFVGDASAINPTGGVSVVAELCSGQNINAFRLAYVEFSEVNAAGFEKYDTIITCRQAGGAIINPTIVKILDQ